MSISNFRAWDIIEDTYTILNGAKATIGLAKVSKTLPDVEAPEDLLKGAIASTNMPFLLIQPDPNGAHTVEHETVCAEECRFRIQLWGLVHTSVESGAEKPLSKTMLELVEAIHNQMMTPKLAREFRGSEVTESNLEEFSLSGETMHPHGIFTMTYSIPFSFSRSDA